MLPGPSGEFKMSVFVCETTYPEEMGEGLWDVPSIPFFESTNPIYIGVRTGQVSRMKKAISQEKLGGQSVGFWEVITKKGKINWDLLRSHDAVFIASPTRCHEKFREQYSQLVDIIKATL